MAVKPKTETVQTVVLNDRWVNEVQVLDDDGCAVTDATMVVTVTPPTGPSVPVTPEAIDGDRYRWAYVPTVSTGRWIASVSADGYGLTYFIADVVDVAAGVDMPTLEQVLSYLGWTEDTANNDAATALATETSAQAAICVVGPVYPNDLRGALYRRVARNLALKKLPVAVLRGDGEVGPMVLPGNDPEVRRLERPHRKLFFR
jgi:hypothetical protein